MVLSGLLSSKFVNKDKPAVISPASCQKFIVGQPTDGAGLLPMDVQHGSQGGALYLASHTRHARQPVTPAQPISQFDPQSWQFWSNLTQEQRGHDDNQDGMGEGAGLDGVGPSGTSDFGSYYVCAYSYEDYYREVRNRYVMGLQMMIEAQCEALVEKFNVKPLICGIIGPIWLRFVASTKVFDDGWADEAIHQSEIQKSGEAEDFKPRACYKAEPHNIHGCHVAREAVLPTDIIKWSVEGELTYFDAFVEIEKRIGQSLPPFPLSLRSMFRPLHAVPAQKLESLAATIAQCISLNLPPVNFYVIASRYLKELSLPVVKILPHACRIYEWLMPPKLRHNLPTKSDEAVSKDPTSSSKVTDNAENGSGSPQCVDDRGTSSTRNSLHEHESVFDAVELLCNLEARYNEINNAYGGVKCMTDLSKDHTIISTILSGCDLCWIRAACGLLPRGEKFN
ncbi:hypothetical protein CRYUN_Cryun21dG0011100 [Craigia yunnanensis]